MSAKQRTLETPAEPEGQPALWPAYEGDERRAVAIRSLRRKREFWMHCTAYLIVNGMLVAVWLVLGVTTGAWFFWPIFPLAGWGIGLAFHAVNAYGGANRPITEAEIQNEIQHLQLH